MHRQASSLSIGSDSDSKDSIRRREGILGIGGSSESQHFYAKTSSIRTQAKKNIITSHVFSEYL